MTADWERPIFIMPFLKGSFMHVEGKMAHHLDVLSRALREASKQMDQEWYEGFLGIQ